MVFAVCEKAGLTTIAFEGGLRGPDSEKGGLGATMNEVTAYDGGGLVVDVAVGPAAAVVALAANYSGCRLLEAFM